MKNVLFLVMILAFFGCKKEYEFGGTIQLQDFYTKKPIQGQTVTLLQCKSGLMWGHSCYNLSQKQSDADGKAIFFERAKSSFGSSLEFTVEIGNGYMSTANQSIETRSTITVDLKPLRTLQLTINNNSGADSLQIYCSTHAGLSDQELLINSSTTQLMVVPDDENQLSISAFKNGSSVGYSTYVLLPSNDNSNTLTVDFPK